MHHQAQIGTRRGGGQRRQGGNRRGNGDPRLRMPVESLAPRDLLSRSLSHPEFAVNSGKCFSLNGRYIVEDDFRETMAFGRWLAA
jgi:hypothetical protein